MEQSSSKVSTLEVVDDRKKIIKAVVGAICHEVGFSLIKEDVLEVLVSMYIAYLSELSQSTKQNCEHSGRTSAIPSDAMLAMLDLGQDITKLPAFAFRASKTPIPPPMYQQKQNPPKILQTGSKKQLLPYIPDHFPSFPDSHSYISTPTVKQPITDYQTLREKSATQKRNVERGLTNFMARTDQSKLTYSLFPNDRIFPLVGIKTDNVPCLSALVPREGEIRNKMANKMGMCQLNSLIRKHRIGAGESTAGQQQSGEPLVDIVKHFATDDNQAHEPANVELENVDSLFIRPAVPVDDFDSMI